MEILCMPCLVRSEFAASSSRSILWRRFRIHWLVYCMIDFSSVERIVPSKSQSDWIHEERIVVEKHTGAPQPSVN